MNEKAIFIDIDNTLCGKNGVNFRNYQAIKRARSMGHYVFINTGRSRSWIPPNIVNEAAFDGIITGMGTRVEYAGKVLREITIDIRVITEILHYFWNNPEICCFVSGTQRGFIYNPISFFKNYDLISINSPDDFSKIYKEEKIQKIEFLVNKISDNDISFIEKILSVCEHGTFLECAPKGCTKAGAMQYIANYLGLKKDNVYAIGDSENDIDMLKNAGHSIAMFNASDKVKRIADFISTSCDSGGVGYAIDNFILRY